MTPEFSGRPLAEVVRTVAGAVAESQADLDRQAMATQRDLDRAVEAGDLAYAPTPPWLRFAEVDIDLQLTMSIDSEEEFDGEGRVRAYRPYLKATPVSPSKREVTKEAELASHVRVRIVPTPAERRRE